MPTLQLTGTAIVSADPWILLPDEIRVTEEGGAVAHHAGNEDAEYRSLTQLCQAYALPLGEVRRLMSGVE